MAYAPKSLLIGCIADDFTGGSDAASFLRKAGLNTVLLDGTANIYLPDRKAEAIVVALKSRAILPSDAVAQSLKAADWLLAQGAEHIYFKYCSTFDSTSRGNIGPVTDALLERTGSLYTILCPALPVNGRTVKDGILYVHGVPLAESPMRYHPVNPMTESYLPALMEAQSRYPCHCISMTDPIPTDPCTLVPPYVTDKDGALIAQRFGHLPLLTGGSGLLEHLGRRYKPEATETLPHSAPGFRGRRLILSGSCSQMTQKQLACYLDQGGAAIRIEPDKILSGQQTEDTLTCAIAAADTDLLIYSTAAEEDVQKYQMLGTQKISALLESLMGRLAVFGTEHGVCNIIVAGGEASGAVAQALGVNAYQISEDAAPGVPVLLPLDRPKLRLILKSGNFGAEDFFLTALRSTKP